MPRSGGIVAVVADQVLQHRCLAPARVRALEHLGELLRVADEDDVARAGAHRERVGERDLAGLVDEQVVERRCRRSSRRRATPCRRRRRRRCRPSASVTFSMCRRPRTRTRGCRRSPSSARGSRARAPPAASSTASSRLWIALWLVEATPTVLPASIRSAISRPDVHVLPDPGGPWMTRWPPSSRAASAFISSRSVVCIGAVERLAARGSTRAPGSAWSPASSERPMRSSASS